MLRYAHDIVEERIIACKKHQSACKRFLLEMENVTQEEYSYFLDEAEVYAFTKWASLFRHTKGILAGESILLTDFQLFIITNLFGWRRKKDSRRRFRKAYIQLARKNGKSQLLALITSYLCFLSTEQEECYIAGWGREQSSIVYQEIVSQIGSCRLLKGKYRDSYGRITHIKSGSVIQPLSKEARKTGDGKNPSIAVIDEFHAHETSEIYDVLQSGMVARKSPLMVIITTSGFDLNRPCYREYQYVSQVLDESSPISNEEYFILICELDPNDTIQDERNWIKANPIVATYEEGMHFLRRELQVARDVPEKMRNFLTKNMNIWVDQKENGYLSLDRWKACGIKMLPDLQEKECFVGVDLSKKIDLTSIGWVFPFDDGKYVVLSHSFMPEETLVAKRRTDKVPYDLWVKEGWITLTPGAVVDYLFVQKFIEDKAKENAWKVREIDYDPYNATQFAQEMENEGYQVVEIRQGIRTLSESTKHFRESVLSGKVIHDHNPVLTWAINNAVVRQDHNENIMLDKDKSTNRIDPITAVLNAHTRAMLMKEERSVYEIRGPRRL